MGVPYDPAVDTTQAGPRAPALARLVIPAALVGAGSALTLIALSVVSKRLEDWLWKSLPDHLGIGGGSAAWIIGVLVAAGLVVGLIVRFAPGHAGPDPATQELVSAPLGPGVLPGLAAAVAVGLAGGVSLGPENPIVAINVGLAVWLGTKATQRVDVPAWLAFAAAGTIGAMFGTPVGAVLVLTETPARPGDPGMWDRLFAPVVAAGAGALTMDVFSQPILDVAVPDYAKAHWGDLLSAPIIAVVGVLITLPLVYAFPYVHGAFARLTNPIAALVTGGAVLGVLGAIGGRITLFKGLDEMRELVATTSSNGRLVVIIVVKLAALLVAATCGFRGGRIFPAVFVAVALGSLAHQLVDRVPLSLAIAAAILGVLLVVTRSGWLSLFMAATIVGSVHVVPILCFALIPAWLLVTDRPPLVIEPEPGVFPPPEGAADDAG